VSQTLYKDTLKISKNVSAAVAQPDGATIPLAPKVGKKESKINKICDAFLVALQNRVDTNLQNLITAHVCKSPPDMEAGLGLAAGLRSKYLALFVLLNNWVRTNRIIEQQPEQAEEAIAHMCFLTDAQRLYSHALGVYDLELTLLVAQQAQMVRPWDALPVLSLTTNEFSGPSRVPTIPSEATTAPRDSASI
jgi:elongator complex protein 1